MITCNFKGRLGNMLWEIASTIGIAKRNGTSATFPAWNYDQYFETPLNHALEYTPILKEPHFHYADIITQPYACLDGYFQSEKYFAHAEKEVRQQFRFKDSFLQSIKAKMPVGKPTFAISIRRGDYVNNPNYYQIPISWYIQAILSIPDWQDHNILFFSDNLDYCRVHFECLPNAYFMHGKDIEQLAMMSLCDKHIISNSTFSWWGAYLSQSETVIHTGEMFGPRQAHLNSKDYYPERWTKLVCDKIDLMNVTFTIPVHFDHADRMNNLNLSVCMLQTDFNTNIIVGEQGSDKFKYMEQWAKYVKFEDKEFHRTKMLNDMCRMSETDIVVNWDCDVFVPPMQIVLSVSALIAHTADIIYPYDGRFARMPRTEWFKVIESHLDIGIVGATPFKGKGGNPMPVSSVGGALMYWKDSFIHAGMENENFVSYGPEDGERWNRFHILGLNVKRIKGCLYHMDHFIGMNSSKQHKYFANNEMEKNKVLSMDMENLRAYVDSWEWCKLPAETIN